MIDTALARLRLRTPRPAMVVHGGVWDSKRHKLVYTMAELMAVYDPAARRWETLPAKTILDEQELAGAPAVYGVGAYYDPVNDEIVLFPHFTAKNIDLRATTGQCRGLRAVKPRDSRATRMRRISSATTSTYRIMKPMICTSC